MVARSSVSASVVGKAGKVEVLSLGAEREREPPIRAMADQMERALTIAVVQADENATLGNALCAAEWVLSLIHI